MLELKRINDYIIEDLVGEGASGKVYKAVGADAKTYAIKLIYIKSMMKQAIRQQGLLLASISHPNILRAREFFFFDKQRYFVIVTDYCQEGGLNTLIGSIDTDKLQPIMLAIAEGLRYLHKERNIVHRDLKPENILMDGNNPKIADLGIAKVLKRYRASTRIGTPLYMAEEMFSGDYNTQVDIWSLGIIYLQLILGRRIFEMLKGEEIPCRVKTFPSKQLLAEISDQRMRGMIVDMLRKDPRERIGIQKVLKYLKDDSLSSVEIKSQSQTKDNKFMDKVSECYTKTNDYWFGRCSLKQIKQIYHKSMLEIQKQAERGSSKAQYLLGKIYDLGCGISLNKNKAKEWFLEAYAQEQSHCCYELYLGCCDEKQKKQYIRNGVSLGQIRCQYRQAQSYLQGLDGHQKDYEQAAQFIQQICDKQYPKAYKLLGKIQGKKDTQFYNQDGMMNSYRIGVSLRDVGCMIDLAQELYKLKLYKQSLDLGQQIQNGEQLEEVQRLMGYQIKAKAYCKLKDYHNAIQYLKKCIQIDDGTLQKDFRGQLAKVYELAGQNLQAIYWFNEAILRMLPKYQEAQFYRYRLKKVCSHFYILLCQQKMYQNAYTIAKVKQDMGLDEGKADRASMLYRGIGVMQDSQKGLQMLKQLSKNGNSQAKSQLKDIQMDKTY